MNLRELADEMQKLAEEHGDLEVVWSDGYGEIYPIVGIDSWQVIIQTGPRIGYRLQAYAENSRKPATHVMMDFEI
ncbi:MAG: hypothetical protein AAFX78_02695 [Cyanobacteria bacterium J06638_20]